MNHPDQSDADQLLTSCIQRIATGPTMSKDLSREDARAAMQAILVGRAEPVQAAIFLIALRMKRETDAELRGVFEAIRSCTHAIAAPVDELVDLADPYNGYVRHVPATPFLPAVLAACGLPTVSHGLRTVAPKYGITHHMVLAAAGIDVGLSPDQVSARLADPLIGWSYIDQSVFCPALHQLIDLRRLMVKRTCITTLETMTGPVLARGKTHLVTGFVHKDYATIYTDMARHAGFSTALVVRGVEGGVIPPLNKSVAGNSYVGSNPDKAVTLDPELADILAEQRAVTIPEEMVNDAGSIDLAAVAEFSATQGRQALEGKPGLTKDSLIYGASLCLVHARRHSNQRAAANAARDAIDSGRALQHFHRQPD
ncbi:MAG: glycosyl transferase family 3-like protein [Gammaproteobacteria bacterium]|nr:MAG: glycosyl transferase family 3-like protein [Gammaproteobacteria bacterium]TND06808.1 MAG: glycosyl transferase, family 3-like protein [Gammaproteobacteria bacterium]